MVRACFACVVAAFGFGLAAVEPTTVRGGLFPKIDADTWPGWTPSSTFGEQFGSWPDRRVPEEVQVWCKGFIPQNATVDVVGGFPTFPITGPGGIPIPGLLGQCAAIDGRDWSSLPPASDRPTDARFWAWLGVSRGRGAGVTTHAKCGMSHNVCCDRRGCGGGQQYGDVTCSKACPDNEMRALRLACWTPGGTENGTRWASEGGTCEGGAILASKMYIQGRGGNPCGEVLGIKPPPASWDVGVAIFPTKRKVTITGFVDDSPSFECYARAKDDGVWGAPVTLLQLPADIRYNIAVELAGYSDRPVNDDGRLFDLPDARAQSEGIVV